MFFLLNATTAVQPGLQESKVYPEAMRAGSVLGDTVVDSRPSLLGGPRGLWSVCVSLASYRREGRAEWRWGSMVAGNAGA